MSVNTKCAHCSVDLQPSDIREERILCHTCLMIWKHHVEPSILERVAEIVKNSTTKFRPEVIIQTHFNS